MTDKEKAKEYVAENGFVIDLDDITGIEANKEIEEAWLAGFESGEKSKWHDPNNLPKIEIGNSSITVLDDNGNKIYYDYGIKCWRYDDEDLHITTPPIAWCEMPKYIEK